jgi:hypothetical protein
MRRSYLFLLILIILFSSGKIHAQNNVSGMISSNSTWTLSGSPYNVIGGVLVKEGITLTIEAGVTVRVAAGLAIQIDGMLIARGTSSSVVTFTKSGSGNWGYILFSDKSNDATYDIDGNYTGGSILENCVIEFAGGTSVTNNGAVRMDAAHPFINYSTIRNNSATGVRAYNLTGMLKVANCKIRENISADEGAGICINGGSSTIILNNISFNSGGGGTGISISRSQAIVAFNIINNNISSSSNGGAISCYASNYGGSALTINLVNNSIENNITNGAGGAIFLSGFHDTGNIVNILNNYIVNNSAGQGGAIHGAWGAYTANITNNIILNNNSNSDAGGIQTVEGWYTISKNFIIGNSALGNGGGLAIGGSKEINITGNVIASNTSQGNGGGFNGGGNIDFTNNSFINNKANNAGAIYLSPSGYSSTSNIIQYNSVFQNSSTSGNLGNSVFISSQIMINFNNILNNLDNYDILNDNAQNTANLNAKNNWWGTNSDQTIQSRIYDWFDDATKGIVDYQPYEITPRTDAPVSPPSNVLINGNTLSWNPNPEGDIAGYRIYWDTDAGFPYANSINTGKVSSYNIQSIPPGAYIALTAYDSGYNTSNDDLNTITNENQTNGNESWYAEASQSPPSVPVPSVPANGAVDVSTSPTLKWLKSVSAVSYHLQISTDVNFVTGMIFDQTLTDTTKIVSGLANNTNYFWRVNASNAGATSQYSPIWSYRTALISASVASVTGASPICTGGTATYSANSVVLAGGTGSWSSSNAAIATVNSSGLVTGVSAGTCAIIYTITGGTGGTVSAQQSITINPNASVLSVTGLNSFCEIETPSYTANAVILSGGTGAWSSSNTNVATLSTDGVVTAYSGGVCDIFYTISGGCGGVASAKKTVTITPLASASSITASNPLCVGGIATYTVDNLVLGGGTGSWSSDDTGVATINSSGVANGIAAGSCYITYTITGGCGGPTSVVQLINVSPPASISSVTGSSPLCIGSSTTYTANNVIFSGGSGTWSSSNSSVATVSQSGSVQGVAAGTCNIIYTITGGCGGTVSSQRSITIVQNPSIASVTGTTPLCVVGSATYTANSVVLGGGAGSWSSSNPAIATVTSSGFVTGVSAGTSNIIYTITGSCAGTIYKQQSVTVNPAPGIASVSGTSPLCVNSTATFTANSVVLSGGTGAWSSSNTDIATVSSSGLVTAKAAGTCNILYTITGSSCGSTVSAQASVVVNSIPTITGTSPASSCGPGTLTIGAVPSVGIINWYSTQTSGTLLATGSTYTTPFLTSTLTYYAEAVNSNCVSSPRTAINAAIFDVQVPVISKKWNDVLVCSNTANTITGYQWFNGSVPIAGATNQYYVTGKQSGLYKVEITDKNGCKVSSQMLEIAGQWSGAVSIYPNPARKSVAVSFNNEITGRVVLSVLSETGVRIKETISEKIEDDFLGNINVDDLDEGIYIVVVSVDHLLLHLSKIVVIK